MIDTIILRLHGLQKYSRLIKLLEMKERSGFTLETGAVETQEINKLRAKGFNNPQQLLNILKVNRTGEYLVKTQSGKKKNSSGHYEFSYLINWNEDYIEMNFSIPKYVYGMNVLMYVEHCRDVHYKFYENNLLEYNIRRAPALLLAFIKNFLKQEFIDKIDLEDVEINRIDVCFNQVFKSRSEALYYLEYQKKVRKKHSREEGGLPIDYGTSLMHSTKRYSAKIYHKGTEYRKHDLKEHLKINNEKGSQYFNTEKISELADRILRYELTIRKAELNYLFKHNIFRKNCSHFKILYRNYLRISATMQRNDRIAKKIGTLEKDEKELYKSLNPYERITKDDRANYKYVSNLLEKTPKFMLKVDSYSELFNFETILLENSTKGADCDTALFSTQLIAQCLKKLNDFINEFQLKELPEEEIISIKIDRFNNSNKIKLPRAEMLKFYDLLIKSGSFKETARISRYTKATLYRYKDRFKKIGISENNIKPEENFVFPKASLDFNEYHNFLSHTADLVKGKRVVYE